MDEKKVEEIKAAFINKISSELIGMCGGNIKSNLWFCGIEWGNWKFEKKQKHEKYDDFLDECQNCLLSESLNPSTQDQLVKIPSISASGLKYDNSHKIIDLSVYNFDKTIAKIALSYLDKGKEWCPEINEPKSKDDQEIWAKNNHLLNKYMQNTLYQNVKNGIFKLNLYPLSCRSADIWEQNHKVKTGFEEKKEYKVQCKVHRFKLFRDLVVENHPKVIVCIGKSYLEDFLLAFWGKDVYRVDEKITRKIYEKDVIQLKASSLQISIYRKENEPTLVVLPFFSTRDKCLSKDEDLKEIGDYIRHNC